MNDIVKDSDSRYWSVEELNILKKYYPEKGVEFCMKFLPNRTKDSIRREVSKLDIRCKNVFWTEEEEQFMREYYPIFGVKYCMKALNRTRLMIKCKAFNMGLQVQNVKWSVEEDKILRENYPKIGAKGCKVLLPNRDLDPIRKRASYFGLTYKRR